MSRHRLAIDRLAKTGEGVAVLEGRAVFVSGGLPGETVLAEVRDVGRVLRGEVVAIHVPSPTRREPPCPKAGVCGGCDWMHLDEAEQLKWKERIVCSTLEREAGIAPGQYELLPSIIAPRGLGFRRRAVLHGAGKRLGFFARASHARVAIETCPALTAGLASLPGVLADALGSMLKDFDEVRLLESHGRIAVSLHTKGPIKARHRQALEALAKEGIVQGGVLVPGEGLGPPTVVGEPALEEGGLWLRPDGFAQANEELNRRLVERGVALLALSGTEAVLELYAGNGNFTFAVAAAAASTVAVESSGVSVMLAQRAAQKRDRQGLRFVQGDAAQIASGLIREGRRFDRLLVDPPRTGAPQVAVWAACLGVSRVVYVACDPVSLARGAASLKAAGFLPVALQLVDLFPQTHHVEAVMAFGAA